MCGLEKPLDQFYASARGAQGRRGSCKDCCLPYLKEYRRTHKRPKEEQRERSRLRRLTNREECNAATRRSLKKKKDQVRAFVVAHKSKPCADCGHSYPPYVMDFDHVRGQKKFELSQFYVRLYTPRAELLEEIAKCDVVCANCHRERTWRHRYGAELTERDVETVVNALREALA